MRVAPLGGVETPDVVPTDEGYLAVHDQQLAVVERIAAWHEQVARAMDRAIAQRMDAGGKLLELTRHDEIAENVEDHIHRDILLGLARQVLLEFLTDRIIFPDERLEVNTFSGGVNGGEHRIIHVAPIGVDLERVAVESDLRQLIMGKGCRSAPVLPLFIYRGEHGDSDRLQRHHDRERSREETDNEMAAWHAEQPPLPGRRIAWLSHRCLSPRSEERRV